MGYKLNDSASFAPFCVKVSAKSGKVTLGEHVADGVKNGAYLEINANSNSHEYCFYDNNKMVGPAFKRQGAGFEYSFSDGTNPYIGFRIKYEDGNFYIGLYDNSGSYTGESIKIYEDGRISFVAGGRFGIVSKEVPTNIKFAKINNKKYDYDIKGMTFRSSNPHLIPVHYDGKHPAAITMYGAMYAEYYNSDLRFLSESYTKLQEQLRKLNREYKTGYGYYPYKSGGVRLGHIKNMDGVAVFNGPCIYFNKEQYQLGMVGVESKKNDISLLCDFRKNQFEIARFSLNDHFGFSILITSKGIEMCYKFNNEPTDKLYIDYSLNITMQYQNGKTVSLPYSLDISEDLVEEDTKDNKDLEVEKACNEEWEKIKYKYRDFDSSVRFDKQIVGNTTKYVPLVTILKYEPKYVASNLVIPEEVEKIDKGFLGYKKNLVHSVDIQSKIVQSFDNAFENMQYLEKLTFNEEIFCTIKSYDFAFNKIKAVRLPKHTTLVERNAFYKCNELEVAYVPMCCKIEPNAFPTTCTIFYYDGIMVGKEKEEKELNKIAEKQLKINEKNRQKNDSKKPLSNKEKLKLEREREAKLKGASNVFGPKPKVLEKPTPKPTPSKKKEIVKKKKRKNIFKTILAVLAAPFIAIGNFFKSFVSWLKEIEISPLLLLFLTLGITAFYIYMGQTGNVHKLIWKIDLGEGGTIGQYLLNNYDFKLASFIIPLYEKTSMMFPDTVNLIGFVVRGVLYVLLSGALIVCGALDIVAYVLIAVIFWFVIGLVLNLAYQLLMYVGIPLAVPLFSFIIAGKTDEKAIPMINGIISGVATIYYLYLFVLNVIASA